MLHIQEDILKAFAAIAEQYFYLTIFYTAVKKYCGIAHEAVKCENSYEFIDIYDYSVYPII